MRLGTMRFPRTGLAMMVVTLTLLLTACGGSGANSARAQSATLPSPTPKATLPPLNWRKLTVPIDLTHGGVSLSVSPVNGRDAWICGHGSAGHFLIWRTQDAGATWNQISSLLPVAPQPNVVGGCSVIPDQNLASSLAIWFQTNDPNTPGAEGGALDYYSSDGGLSWTRAPQNWWIDQVATSGDTTYALVNDLAHQSNVNLFASSDHFNTWSSVNPQVSETAQDPPVLWIAPNSGDALLSLSYMNQIYHSTNGGGQWTQLTAQSGQLPGSPQAIWRGQSAGWLICGGLPNGASTQILCSSDLGKTWTARPAAVGTSCSPVGLTGDGALYDVCLAANAYSSPEPYALTRLSLGASAWTPVGQAPDKYITVTQTGQVWCSAGDGSATYVLDALP